VVCPVAGTTRLGWIVLKKWRWKLPLTPQLGTGGGWPLQNTGRGPSLCTPMLADVCILPECTPPCDTYLCSCVVIYFFIIHSYHAHILEGRSVRLTVSMARRPTCSLSTNGRRGVLLSEVCHPAYLQMYSRVCVPFFLHVCCGSSFLTPR
jgi:hypothetical protein